MEDNKIDDMLVGRIYKGQFKETLNDINKIVAIKIKEKIELKQNEFIKSMENR